MLSKGDWILTKTAIPGTKSAIQSYYGYGGYSRRPLKRLLREKVNAVAEGIKGVMEIEKSLWVTILFFDIGVFFFAHVLPSSNTF